MPNILNLKFKGNKSFVAFSNLSDSDALTKTWKVCTKVASYLEQGQRLENLSWRLWHLHSLMVDTDNAKSKREFKKLSKCMGDKLDKEKGRSIEELEAPDFKRNHSTDLIRQRAEEKERSREASQNAKPGTIKRLQFTFSVDQPTPAVSYPVKKPDLKPSPEFTKRTRNAVRAPAAAVTRTTSAPNESDEMIIADDGANDKDPPLTQRGRKTQALVSSPQSLRFPTLFSNDFDPSALLYPTPTVTNPMNYGEGLNPSVSSDGFSIVRPTIELSLDELLNNVDSNDSLSFRSTRANSNNPQVPSSQQDVVMQSVSVPSKSSNSSSSTSKSASSSGHESDEESNNDSDDESSDVDLTSTSKLSNGPPISQTIKEVLPQTVVPSKVNSIDLRSNTPTGRPILTVRTHGTPATRSSGPGATATSLNPAVLRSGGNNTNNAPGGVKAECSNCGATHTPLWRRGLNDELNCNACGLYCKLHKRPRPKNMRSNHGEGRAQATPRQESVDVMAQCYNCHTTATPLWRKDDEGKTVCNACGLYYKLHGTSRPISMKSDVIRKRSRHDARRAPNGVTETPSASPGVSRRASPIREQSPILAPDSTTQMNYEYIEENDYRVPHSELMGALGHDNSQNIGYSYQGYGNMFPGPYHPDYMPFSSLQDPLPFSSVDNSDIESSPMSPRTNKRRRMSTDSASEPPSSAVSFSSYNDGYTTSSSATSHSQRSSLDFHFATFQNSNYNCGTGLRGSGNTFWHPPMLPQGDNSPQLSFHPPMLPSAEESPMDYLHPPMLPQEEDSLFSTYLHPPMILPDDSSSRINSHSHSTIFSSDYGHSDTYDTSMRMY